MKAAVFDVDGTLADSTEFWNNLARNYLLTLDIEAKDDLNIVLQTLTVEQGLFYIKEAYGVDKTLGLIREEMDVMMFKFYNEEVELKSHVLELLDLLKSKEIKMGIATLTEENLIEAMLARHGIRDYFEFIQTPTNSGIGKEDKNFYHLLRDRLELHPEEIVFFEDSLYAIIPAKKSGMKVIGVEDEASLGDKEEIKEIADDYIKNFHQFIKDFNKSS